MDMPKPKNDRFEKCHNCSEEVDTAGKHSRVSLASVYRFEVTGTFDALGQLQLDIGKGEKGGNPVKRGTGDSTQAMCQACALQEPKAYASEGF